MPQRIQLSRRKGWRKPDGAIVVARPSRWGNPISASKIASTWVRDADDPEFDHPTGITEGRRLAVAWFQHERDTYDYPTDDEIREHLAGHDLACWCPLDQPCHADVLLEIANDA